MLNPHIFRAYDIRGIADTDLTNEAVKLIGQACGKYLITHFGPRIAVGHDCRISSPRVSEAFIKGLTLSGCQVTEIGLCTSPMLYFAVCEGGFDGGAAITASHNPKEYNGIKLVGPHAHSICDQELQKILKIAEQQAEPAGEEGRVYRTGSLSEGFFSKNENSKNQNKVAPINSSNIFDKYLQKVTSLIKLSRPLKIGIDAGNGAAGPFAPKIFQALGCEVHELYCQPDGDFPNHEANPEYAENLAELSQLVQEKKLDFGIGFDGDGDRIGIINEKGEHNSADQLIILLARELLGRKPGSPIVFDIKCSRMVEQEIEKLGGKAVMTRTGHSFIENKMKELNSPLAGEISGHIFIGDPYYGYDDAIFTAAKVAEIISKSPAPYSSHFSNLPKTFTTPEIKAPCADSIKFQLLEEIKNYFQSRYPCLTIDGVRINFDENSWGVIRCSNTSPNLTMRFEAPSAEQLKQIQQIVYEKLKDYDEIENSWYKNP